MGFKNISVGNLFKMYLNIFKTEVDKKKLVEVKR